MTQQLHLFIIGGEYLGIWYVAVTLWLVPSLGQLGLNLILELRLLSVFEG
jgi:hypothetical protein